MAHGIVRLMAYQEISSRLSVGELEGHKNGREEADSLDICFVLVAPLRDSWSGAKAPNLDLCS